MNFWRIIIIMVCDISFCGKGLLFAVQFLKLFNFFFRGAIEILVQLQTVFFPEL